MAQCKQDMYMNHSTVTYHRLNTTGINHNMYHKIAHYHSYLHHVSRACAPSSPFSFAHTHTHTHTPHNPTVISVSDKTLHSKTDIIQA